MLTARVFCRAAFRLKGSSSSEPKSCLMMGVASHHHQRSSSRCLAPQPAAARPGDPTSLMTRRRQPLALTAAMASDVTSSAAAPMERTSAALLIVGNEILSGSIQDTNTQWLARSLYNRGVDMVRVEMIPDDIDDIVATLHRLRERVGPQGAIFTSGGIGPTHDDVTYEAIAKATGTTLALHDPTVEKMKAHYGAQGKELNEARLRMATLPVGCEVLWTEGLWVPLVNMDEVYVLPGIPRLFQAMLGGNLDRFKGPAMHQAHVYTHMGEGEIAKGLGDIAKQFPSVNIGSYPNVSTDKTDFTTKLNFESRDKEAMEQAAEATKAAFDCFSKL